MLAVQTALLGSSPAPRPAPALTHPLRPSVRFSGLDIGDPGELYRLHFRPITAEDELKASDWVPAKFGAGRTKCGLPFLKEVLRVMPLMISFKLKSF